MSMSHFMIELKLRNGLVSTGGREEVSYLHSLVDTIGFKSEHAGLEEDFGGTEAGKRHKPSPRQGFRELTVRCQ